MKEITDVTPEGITYIDEEGNQQFIDFETCFQNNLKDIEKSMGSRDPEERKKLYQRAKYVGVRYAFGEPPTIVFYTVPSTEFEFPTLDRFYEVLVGIKKAGWRTNDGE